MLDFTSLLVLAFFFEMVDNGLGGGFGTIMSPLLVLLGYNPKLLVPAILVSETISGLWGGFWHRRFHNINWKAAGLTLMGSLAAMALATYVMSTILSPASLKQIISILAVTMGIFVVIRSYLTKQISKMNLSKHTWLIAVMGFMIGYNKGSSGGSYGPFSVTGYMVMGLPAAVAIGTTTVAEGIACALGVGILTQTGGVFNITVIAAITIGAFIADPISAFINHRLKNKLSPPFHGRIIGLAMTFVGLIALLRIFGWI